MQWITKKHLAQISEDGRNLESMSCFFSSFSEFWCSLNGLCVEVTLLSQVTNVGGSPKKLFIPVDPPG